MHNYSYENEFNLHVNEISFSYERMSTKTRFEKEAKGNSEMPQYRVMEHVGSLDSTHETRDGLGYRLGQLFTLLSCSPNFPRAPQLDCAR